MKRVLRLLTLIAATVFGTSFLLHLFSYPKEDVPALVWAGIIFVCFGATYLYLARSARSITK